MRYRTALGDFEFEEATNHTMAALIVDTVVGQYFAPKPGEPILIGEDSCYEYMRGHMSNEVSAIAFNLEIKPEVRRQKRTKTGRIFVEDAVSRDTAKRYLPRNLQPASV